MKKKNRIIYGRTLLVILIALKLMAVDVYISRQGWFRKACYGLIMDGIKYRTEKFLRRW